MARIAWPLVATMLLASGFLLVAPLSEGQSKREKPSTQKEAGQKSDAQNVSKSTASIILGASANNSVQIKALNQAKITVWEIQLGGGSNQPPSHTHITGQASTEVGGTTYAGYYRLSTEPTAQLQMKRKAAGTKPGVDKDEYSFLTGHDLLTFEFAPTSTFANPWLTGPITIVSATQQVPSEDNGDEHPPISLSGKISAPTGGSLAQSFGSGDSQLSLNVGGNQRLAELQLGNTLSGMHLDKGSRYSANLKSPRKE